MKIQWDCRGMRLEEFEHLIQDLCGHVMAKSMPYAEIIHGHGNGVLKHSIRNQLKNHPDLEAIIDPLKSDGVTVIKLK
jgi:DNA mismatch repair protein MutS2